MESKEKQMNQAHWSGMLQWTEELAFQDKKDSEMRTDNSRPHRSRLVGYAIIISHNFVFYFCFYWMSWCLKQSSVEFLSSFRKKQNMFVRITIHIHIYCNGDSDNECLPEYWLGHIFLSKPDPRIIFHVWNQPQPHAAEFELWFFFSMALVRCLCLTPKKIYRSEKKFPLTLKQSRHLSAPGICLFVWCSLKFRTGILELFKLKFGLPDRTLSKPSGRVPSGFFGYLPSNVYYKSC